MHKMFEKTVNCLPAASIWTQMFVSHPKLSQQELGVHMLACTVINGTADIFQKQR